MREAIKAFCVGSSLPVTLWPLLGLAVADARNATPQIDFSVVDLVFPLVFGLVNIVTVRFGGQQTMLRMFTIGALAGLALASTGTFLLDIPGNVYHLEGASRYLALVIGPVFYGLVWAIPLKLLNALFELGQVRK